MESRVEVKPAIKLAICIPHMGTWKSSFGLSFAQLCAYTSTQLFENNQARDIVVFDKVTSILPRSRQECLEDALFHKCTHALFLDSDQSFPYDTAHRLLAWKKPIVACNIAVKAVPSFPTARAKGPTCFGVPITSEGKRGIEKVWRIGCGVMLLDTSILKDMPKPWFEQTYSVENSTYIGEDWYFVAKAEAAGHDTFVDHDLSKQIGHVGDYVFTHVNIPSIPADLAEAA